MSRLSTETFGGGDQSWVGSPELLGFARTEILDISAFNANTHYPDGYVKSGTAVAKVAGVLVPYASGAGDGTAVLAGFVQTDQKVVGSKDFSVPLYDKGRVKTANLPIAWVAPASAANDKTQCVFI